MPYQGDNLMSVKRSNRSAALRILLEKGAMSRKRLAENMHLTPAAITKIVGDLIDDGLLREGETLNSGSAGRREILIDLNPYQSCALGVLINLRQAIVSAVWLNGEVLFAEELEIPRRADAGELVPRLSRLLKEKLKEFGISFEENEPERFGVCGFRIPT